MRSPRRPPGFTVTASTRTRRSQCSRTTGVGSGACSSTRRSCTRRTAWRCCALPARTGRDRRRLGDGVGHRRAGRQIRERVGDRAGDLRTVGRRRLVGGRSARPPGDRPPADLHLRRHRPDAQGRERPGRRDVPAQPRHRTDPRRRGRAVLRGARRRDRAGGEAQDDRRAVHPGLRGAHRRADRRQVPGAGHAVPRPDRERRRRRHRRR